MWRDQELDLEGNYRWTRSAVVHSYDCRSRYPVSSYDACSGLIAILEVWDGCKDTSFGNTSVFERVGAQVSRRSQSNARRVSAIVPTSCPQVLLLRQCFRFPQVSPHPIFARQDSLMLDARMGWDRWRCLDPEVRRRWSRNCVNFTKTVKSGSQISVHRKYEPGALLINLAGTRDSGSTSEVAFTNTFPGHK